VAEHEWRDGRARSWVIHARREVENLSGNVAIEAELFVDSDQPVANLRFVDVPAHPVEAERGGVPAQDAVVAAFELVAVLELDRPALTTRQQQTVGRAVRFARQSALSGERRGLAKLLTHLALGEPFGGTGLMGEQVVGEVDYGHVVREMGVPGLGLAQAARDDACAPNAGRV
jgi:hypothetical protein